MASVARACDPAGRGRAAPLRRRAGRRGPAPARSRRGAGHRAPAERIVGGTVGTHSRPLADGWRGRRSMLGSVLIALTLAAAAAPPTARAAPPMPYVDKG